MCDIVLVDQDSTAVPPGCVLEGVASKFEREGFAGKLWFVTGGYHSVAANECFQLVSGAPEVASDDQPPAGAVPRLGQLSRLAFQQGGLVFVNV
jgi:hypothetical protein